MLGTIETEQTFTQDRKTSYIYKLPMGILGNIANTLFVRKQLKGIFTYRHQKLEALFGKAR